MSEIDPVDAAKAGSALATPPPLRATLIDILLRQPSLIISLAYVATSSIGVWGSYWYYRTLGVPILDFLQLGDFLVAGLREPIYIVLVIVALLSSWIGNIPYGWRETQPERYARLRKHWWFRFTYMEMPAWTGARRLPPGTGVFIGVIWIMLWSVFSYVHGKAQLVRAGQGTQIVLGDGDTGSDTRLLGTTTAWVFVWHVERRQAEALPIESISRIGLVRPVVVPAPVVTPAVEPAQPPATSDVP